MKKTLIKVLALSLIAVMLVGTLASCGKVSGAYTADLTVLGQGATVTYDFKMFGKVEITTVTTLLGQSSTTVTKGTYEIVENADGKMEITFTFEDETDESKEYSGTRTFSIDEENETITMGLVTYKKVK